MPPSTIYTLSIIMATRKTPRIKSWTRLWQRRGFGVHSPYAYRLITEVIREKARFYAYDELATIQNKNARNGYKIKKKRARMLFRMVNRFQPKHILEIGSSGGITTLYMKRACSHSNITIAEPRHEIAEQTRNLLAGKGCKAVVAETDFKTALQDYLRTPDICPFILINRLPSTAYDDMAALLNEALLPYAILLIDGIDHKAQRTMWRSLVSDERVRVAMDMKHYGLILCNPKLNKQNYYI